MIRHLKLVKENAEDENELIIEISGVQPKLVHGLKSRVQKLIRLIFIESFLENFFCHFFENLRKIVRKIQILGRKLDAPDLI
jgi:hypothetical protein